MGIATKVNQRRQTMNEWIKDLKPGDKVIVSSRYSESIKTVDRVTPSGRIVIGAITFNNDGGERGRDIWIAKMLREATESELRRVHEKNTIQKAANIMRTASNKTITYDQAVAIIKILEGEIDAE